MVPIPAPVFVRYPDFKRVTDYKFPWDQISVITNFRDYKFPWLQIFVITNFREIKFPWDQINFLTAYNAFTATISAVRNWAIAALQEEYALSP